MSNDLDDSAFLRNQKEFAAQPDHSLEDVTDKDEAEGVVINNDCDDTSHFLTGDLENLPPGPGEGEKLKYKTKM